MDPALIHAKKTDARREMVKVNRTHFDNFQLKL